MRVGIIGAGPAGLTAAYRLCKQGVSVVVYEASPHVGGLSRTMELWGQKVDIGPHRFFTTDKRIRDLWFEVVGSDHVKVKRLTRIRYHDQFLSYPLKPFDALSAVGPLKAIACVLSFLMEKIPFRRRDTSTFEGWVVKRFGRHLFNTFFKAYSEKLWGIPCDQLDSTFAVQRIKKLSLYEAVKNALQLVRTNKHRTLVDEFYYPREGSGMVYERMSRFIESTSGKILRDCPIQSLAMEGNRVVGIRLKGGEVERFDQVISTMPLTHLVQSLPELPNEVREATESLKFRNTILVYLEVGSRKLFPDNWIYIHDPRLRTGRITNFRNWSPSLCASSGNTIVAMEYWCNDEDALWKDSDESIGEMARGEFAKLGFEGSLLAHHVYRVRRSYPIYELGYQEKVKTISAFLNRFENLMAIGRYGSFKYNNQDHSILMGILAAENILYSAGHDLWQTNADDKYQEEAPVTELAPSTLQDRETRLAA